MLAGWELGIYRELNVQIRELGIYKNIVKRLPLDFLLYDHNTTTMIKKEQTLAVAAASTTATMDSGG